MLKSSLIVSFLVLLSRILFAQHPTFTINETILRAGQYPPIDASPYTYSPPAVALLPSISIASSASPALPSVFTAAMLKGTTLSNPVSLSPTAQILQTDVLALLGLGGGAFSIRYSITSLSSVAWTAGDYTNSLTFTFGGVIIGVASVNPNPVNLKVSVPAFISMLTDPGDVTLLVNDLKYFRTIDLTSTYFSKYLHTVPLDYTLKGNTTSFTFSNGYSNVIPPTTSTSLVFAKSISPSGTQIPLSNSYQSILPGTQPVLIGNATSVTIQYAISTANLLSGFKNKGTYTSQMNMQVKDAANTASLIKPINLTVVVSDMADLSINGSAISLQLLTADNYRNGVSQDMLNHLSVSKTTPYVVTVQAAETTLKKGATDNIPVSILSIGPTTPTAGINTITSLSTSPQTLISSSSADIDKNISIRYRIDSSKIPSLFNKAPGTYTGTVTYTLTAL